MNIKNKLKIATMAMFMLCMAVVPAVAGAQDADPFGAAVITDEDNGLNLGKQNFNETIVSVINTGIGLLALIAVIIILIGGFKWMTAGGNDDKVAEARKLIFAGIVGMAIILASWGIASFVLGNLGKATGVEGADALLE